jgi:hypothetical protein
MAGSQHKCPTTCQAALEGVLYMLYACSCVGGEDTDHVEAQGVEVWLVVGDVLFREGAYGSLLTGRYRFERVTEARRAAELHLYEDEAFVVADDEVYFAAALPVVAFDEPVAAPGEVAQREVLAPRAGRLACQSPTPA